MPLRLSSVKETERFFFSAIFRGSMSWLESQLTEPPCRWMNQLFTAIILPIIKRKNSKNVFWVHLNELFWNYNDFKRNVTYSLRFHIDQIEERISTVSLYWQTDGQIQKADGHRACRNLWEMFTITDYFFFFKRKTTKLVWMMWVLRLHSSATPWLWS